MLTNCLPDWDITDHMRSMAFNIRNIGQGLYAIFRIKHITSKHIVAYLKCNGPMGRLESGDPVNTKNSIE